MREIELTQGQVALVDDCDFERLARHKWYALKTRGGKFYAARTRRSTPTKTLLMHRVILGLRSRKTLVDHRDHDTLNNVRANIRPCTNHQNQQNRKHRRLKGFIFNRKNNNYNARIKFDGKLIHLGVFKTPEEAARCYDKAAAKHFGEFACLNFPEAA